MALTTISITQGTGTPIAVDNCGAAGFIELTKLAYSAAGVATPIQADVNGLLVNVSGVAGTVTVAGTVAISGNPAVAQSGTWTVTAAALATAPVFVRLSSGTAAVDTIPVTGTVAISGTPNVAIPGGCVVSGTVTSNQGAAASVGSAWPIQVTDATHSSVLQAIGGIYCLPVKVLGQVGGGFSQQENSAFTAGSTFAEVNGGVYNDAFGSAVTTGNSSCFRITPNRALHINLRRQDGTELGTSTTPLIVVGNSSGNLPISGTVSTQLGDHSGNAFTQSNPLSVLPAPSTTGAWKAHVAFTASQTAQAIRTPSGGKTSYIEGFIITQTASGPVTIFDGTNTSSTILYSGTPPVGACIVVTPARPIPLAAANNVLQYTTGSAATGDIVAWGYEQ